MERELKAYNVVATADVNPEVVDNLGCMEWGGYDKSEADAVIAAKDKEIAKLQAIIDERDKTIEELQADYKEACDRLQTANLIKDEQMAKVANQNQTISSLRCEIVDLERRVYAANRDARRTRY